MTLLTIPGDDPIILETRFEVSAARVFRAWTEPAEIMAWFGPRPNSLTDVFIDLRIGGRWKFSESSRTVFEGEYLKIERPHHLSFSWRKAESRGGETLLTDASQVDVHISEESDSTLMRVIHSRIVEDSMRYGFCNGWANGLKQMETHLAADH